MSILGNFVTSHIYGRKRWQAFFEKLHFISLKGLNLGSGSSLSNSGETGIPDLVFERTSTESDLVIFDVGANTGGYSSMCASRLKGKGKKLQFFLFEPNTSLHPLIHRKMEGEQYFLFNTALGSASGTATFFIPESHVRGSLVDNENILNGHAAVRKEQVIVTTLDDMVIETGCKRIDLLKIDVEGSEFDILKGAEKAIDDGIIRAIQFEFGTGQITTRHYLHDYFNLLGTNYTIHRMLKDGISDSLKYNTQLEVFKTTNFIALKKQGN
jgi:FkbM family methyltransferase